MHLLSRSLPFLLLLVLSAEAFAKKDYRGLFGSYRRDKFTENRGEDSDFGLNFMLSTLFPVSPVVKSQIAVGGPLDAMYYSAFFDFEIEATLSMAYVWEFFLRFGFYKYETRKELVPNSTSPQFHEFELEMLPLLLGARYRLSRGDVVPYFGIAGGMAYTKRNGFYDNSNAAHQLYDYAVAGEIQAGFEFYFGPSSGIRLEASLYHLRISEFIFDAGSPGPVSNLPVLAFQANPWLIRYASGLFILF